MRSSITQTTAQPRAKVGGGVARSKASNVADLRFNPSTNPWHAKVLATAARGDSQTCVGNMDFSLIRTADQVRGKVGGVKWAWPHKER